MRLLAARDQLEAERARLVDLGGSRLKPLDDVQARAGLEARQYLDLGSAYVGWSPGNGTSYPFLLHDLERAQFQACLASRKRAFDPGEMTAELEDRLAALARADAARIGGAAGAWGGRLLIAMPGFRRHGAAIAVALMPFYHWSYVAETLNLRTPDAVPVAEFLTLFGDAVLQMEAGTW